MEKKKLTTKKVKTKDESKTVTIKKKETVTPSSEEKKETDSLTLGLSLPILKNKETVQKLLEAGMHFGHKVSRRHPKMAPFIFTEKGGFHIIDVVKTIDMLNSACNFLVNAASKGYIIIVSTKKQAYDGVISAAKRCGAYYVVNRWPGGLFTNLSVLRKSIEKLDVVEKQLLEGVWNRTKKELLLMKRELQRLYRLYSGLRGIKSFPTAVVLIDPKREHVVVREAKKLKIPIVALVDTNCDPSLIDYPVPGNDDAVKSIRLFLDTIANAILIGNKGKGVIHKEIDLQQIDIAIETMAEKMRKKKEESIGVKKAKVIKVGGRKVKIIKKSE